MEFRWQVWRCADGHPVAIGEMWYRPGEEPISAEPAPEQIPDYCPRCGAPVRANPELALLDQVSPAQVEVVARLARVPR